MARVSLENVSKRFGRTEVLGDLTLGMEDGALTVLVGPSGCGKSTILRIIAGLEEPTSGDVYVDGHNVNGVAPFRRGVGMVFQSYALYPHMTVYDNLRFGLTSLKLDQLECDKRIREAAELLSLTPYLQRKPKQLSGGQRQRVAMGRALVRKPSVFLFDEPLSNLDASLRTRMRLEIARLRESLSATAVYVTHDQVEAMTLANKIVVLRAGRIEQEGSPLDVYHHPVNKFVAGFLGSPSMNFIPTRVAASTIGEASSLQFPDGSELPMRIEKSVESNEVLEFGIRPEHLTVDAQLPAQLKARVFALEKLGDQTLAHVSLERKGPSSGPVTSLIARLPGDSTVEPGEHLNLGFDPSRAHVFSHSGESIESRFPSA